MNEERRGRAAAADVSTNEEPLAPPGKDARKTLNLAASVGDDVVNFLVQARRATSIAHLGKSIAKLYGVSIPDSYTMTRAAINNLSHLKLVEVDRSSTTVTLTQRFYQTYGDGH